MQQYLINDLILDKQKYTQQYLIDDLIFKLFELCNTFLLLHKYHSFQRYEETFDVILSA